MVHQLIHLQIGRAGLLICRQALLARRLEREGATTRFSAKPSAVHDGMIQWLNYLTF